MNVLPVITRELRAEARHPFTYLLRVLGAAAVIIAATLFTLAFGIQAQLGAKLFQELHFTVQLTIWVLVPLLTADCLSRERREGTLGLLFLTPLRALDIVVAKSLAHGLRALTLLLAALPVVALPLLIGGVSWQQAVSSLLLNGSAICLALAAGLLASAASRTWIRSLILAFCLALLLGATYCTILGWMHGTIVGGSSYFAGVRPLQVGLQIASGINPDVYLSYRLIRVPWGGIAPPTNVVPRYLLSAIEAFSLSLLALFCFALIAAWLTRRNWQERPPHPAETWFRQKLCTPIVMLDLLKRWMKQKLERNPIGWLEQRTWSGRLVIWGWFAAMVSVYSLVLTDANFFTRNLAAVHSLMGWLLLLSLAVNASTSFRRERETRVLELLLVSPLNERQIILGRLRGLWGQFLPSMVMLVGGWLYLSAALGYYDRDGFSLVFLASSFLAVPVAGLYFSLICRNFLVGLLATVGLALVLPVIWPMLLKLCLLVLTLGAFAPNVANFESSIAATILFQLSITAYLQHRLRRRLETRQFAMEST